MLFPLREMESFRQRQLVDLLLLPAHPNELWHNWRILFKGYWNFLTKNLPENVRK
jgi:hypothetical protein